MCKGINNFASDILIGWQKTTSLCLKKILLKSLVEDEMTAEYFFFLNNIFFPEVVLKGFQHFCIVSR